MADHLPRKLAAIFYADVAGYSRLTDEDENTTHMQLGECLDYITESVKNYWSQAMHYIGDAVLVKPEVMVDAVYSAVNIQRLLAQRNENLTDEKKL